MGYSLVRAISKIRPFRANWIDLCQTSGYRGRWVALDNVRYVAHASEPLEADVVDVDDNLVALCNRIRASHRTSCCVLQAVSKRAS